MSNSEKLPPVGNPEALMMDQIRGYLLDAREDYPEPYAMLELTACHLVRLVA